MKKTESKEMLQGLVCPRQETKKNKKLKLCASAIPTEEVGLENKSPFHDQTQREKHEFL